MADNQLKPRMTFSTYSKEGEDVVFARDGHHVDVDSGGAIRSGVRFPVIDTPWADRTDISFELLRHFGVDIVHRDGMYGRRFTIEVANGKAEYEITWVYDRRRICTVKLIHGEQWPINEWGERINEEGRR